ncbi:hypothetical protein SAMN05216489_09005 [Streptomyces sp. 3213]|nr:hypothetical protein SAMN05216489_09005 [Streptomyces sp. 3213] [Streptomyces sp. 3213.3]
MSKVEHLDSTVLIAGRPRTPGSPAAGFAAAGGGNPDSVTAMTTQQELVRFLEDRFACAQACTACARACVLRVGRTDPDATDHEALLRQKALWCAEVCDATCRMLAEQNLQDEPTLRLQAKWCLLVCLECAQLFDERPGAEADARACRDCARACTEFLATLN